MLSPKENNDWFFSKKPVFKAPMLHSAFAA